MPEEALFRHVVQGGLAEWLAIPSRGRAHRVDLPHLVVFSYPALATAAPAS